MVAWNPTLPQPLVSATVARTMATNLPSRAAPATARQDPRIRALAQQMLLAGGTTVLFVGLLLLNHGQHLLQLILRSPQAFVPLALLLVGFLGLFGCAMFASALQGGASDAGDGPSR